MVRERKEWEKKKRGAEKIRMEGRDEVGEEGGRKRLK
jgi:hypothetical protein